MMAARYHAIALLLTIALAYLWLQVPTLRAYSFQVFALFITVFLVVKRFKKAKAWHILPDWASFELAILTFAFLLLIGGTGNTKSIFYPLGYVHLFFLVMTAHIPTAIVATVGIMLFHYALEPELGITTIQSITTLPIMLAIFLFARKQYDEAHLPKIAAEKVENATSSTNSTESTQPSTEKNQENEPADPLNRSTIASAETTETESNTQDQ